MNSGAFYRVHILEQRVHGVTSRFDGTRIPEFLYGDRIPVSVALLDNRWSSVYHRLLLRVERLPWPAAEES
jgi:hypothetical protein